VFYRLPQGWRATVRRGESRYGSDHYPLIAELTVP
jgi:endonuclease/exonuclease/phosphatase (EEP) superfamily protein YafD